MKFFYIEDRDFETGHGWRDEENHVIKLDPLNSDDCLVVHIFNDDGSFDRKWANYSYAYIFPVGTRDDIRTFHLEKQFPGFQGCDDMESHFEFQMSPKQMREYLESLGILRQEN